MNHGLKDTERRHRGLSVVIDGVGQTGRIDNGDVSAVPFFKASGVQTKPGP